MTEYNETALVLEGGGNRGVFTAGVLDYLMEQKVEFPYVVGVSAGACNAMDYVSGQVGRTRRCMIVENKEYSYISLKNILDKKSLFDMDMIFDRYPNEIFPFDFDEYFKSDIECDGCGELSYRRSRVSVRKAGQTETYGYLQSVQQHSGNEPDGNDRRAAVSGWRGGRFHTSYPCHEKRPPEKCGHSYQKSGIP